MTETRSVSVKLDGQASIEHQIDIHVLDLVEARENKDIRVLDILEGLRYIVDYRIKGGKMSHFDQQLMSRLCEGLLHITGKKTGNLLTSRPTEEADLAFQLFTEFTAFIEEFRIAITLFSASDLKEYLKIHKRCQSLATAQQREQCATLLGLLTLRFPQFKDWKELVKDEEHGDVEALIRDYTDKFTNVNLPLPETLFPPPALYFDKNSEKLADMFESSTTTGLNDVQVEKLKLHYGINKLPEPPKTSILYMIWKQLIDFMIIVLLVVAITEAATGDVDTAVVLFVVVLFNVVVGVVQEYQANKALEALLTLDVPTATVIRGGNQISIPAQDLVPGDLVILEEGQAVPADLRLCEVAQLELIESILTGESVPVQKSIRTIRQRTRKLPLGDCKGNAFMTTTVARGRGKGIVVRTGVHTEIGKISAAISSVSETPSGVQIKLNQLGKWLVLICFLLVVLIVIIRSVGYGNPFVPTIKLGISLGVSVIPEGLVAVVTVAIALGVARMAQKNAIIRKPSAVETIGSVTVICSDKTGTLTEGKMAAQCLYTADGNDYEITSFGHLDPLKGEILHNGSKLSDNLDQVSGAYALSMMICGMCHNANVHYDDESAEWKYIGDPTEVALYIASLKSKLSWAKFAKLGEYAFDSDRKLMSSIHQHEQDFFVLVKGAPEAILQRSTRYFHGESWNKFSSKDLDEAFISLISKKAQTMASCGLRVLALATKKVDNDQANQIVKSNKASEAESDLVFVGLIGLIDPPKQGVAESVALCKKAGIRVIMITGDHIDTANAIAKKLNIISDSPNETRSMKGYEIDLLSEEHLSLQKPFPVVFARVSPDNKLKIVKALQRSKELVVMTGDGVNDAPAIKQANVGVAMGKAGTEITKQAAEMVLANDNFSTIVEAVKEGRHVYDNIIKFLVYLLSCNAAEVFLFILSVSLNMEPPFTSIQILWANIFADIPPAMSLGLEPADEDIMERRPRPPEQGVITKVNLIVIMSQSLLLTLISFGIYRMAYDKILDFGTTELQQSLVFSTLTGMQLVQSLLSKSVLLSVFTTGITNNRWLVFSFIFSFSVLVIGVEVPKINDWLQLTSIGYGWGIVLGCCLVHSILVEILKWILRKYATN